MVSSLLYELQCDGLVDVRGLCPVGSAHLEKSMSAQREVRAMCRMYML
jgi:hypothetical protein